VPKPLLARLASDSVQEFRAAAVARFHEAQTLFEAGNTLAAIYFWGYSCEMVLKAGCFSIGGFGPATQIAISDLNLAKQDAKALNVSWPPGSGLHNIECWALLLVQHRSVYAKNYTTPGMATEVIKHARMIYSRWRETLRYHKNRAYNFEVRTVRLSTIWFLENMHRL
jgi:hypothetical protein